MKKHVLFYLSMMGTFIYIGYDILWRLVSPIVRLLSEALQSLGVIEDAFRGDPPRFVDSSRDRIKNKTIISPEET